MLLSSREYFSNDWNKTRPIANQYNLLHRREKLTLTSISPILCAARMIGLPTKDGNVKAGKFDPA